MSNVFPIIPSPALSSVPILLLKHQDPWLKDQSLRIQNLMKRVGSKPGFNIIPIDDESGIIQKIVVMTDLKDSFTVGALCYESLGEGIYHFELKHSTHDLSLLALGWAGESYQFNLYQKESDFKTCQLSMDPAIFENTKLAVESMFMVRDLINTPPNFQSPEAFSQFVSNFSKDNGLEFDCIVGTELLKENYPLIYHVGSGSLLVSEA